MEYSKHIFESGTHLLDLINDLLDISAIEAGKINLADEMLEIAQTMETCHALVADRARAAEVDLKLSAAPTLPRLRADERRIKQIILNLLSNAIKFTPPGGWVELAGGRDAEGRLMV